MHNIHVNVSPLLAANSSGWREQAYNIERGHYHGAAAGFNFPTYEKAREVGLVEGLGLINK